MKKVIGVLLEDEAKQGLKQDFFAAIIEGFRQVINKKGYALMMLNASDDQNRTSYVEQTKEYDLAGVFITTATETEELDELVNCNLPVAVVDKDHDNTINVQSNNSKGMNDLMEYIISMGHRKIAYIMGTEGYVANVRFNEFLKVCSKHSIQIPEEYLVRSRFRDVERAAYYTEKLLKLPDPPTCIVYSDDYAAVGGINVIGARGLEIPRDISVAGYDGNEILSNVEPTITTVAQNNMLMGQIAAEKLIHNIENPDNQIHETITVESEFLFGRSVGQVYTAF